MSELALELIAKEREEKTGKLDLGKCGLTEIPEEVFELMWLEELSFSNRVWSHQGQKWKESSNKGNDNQFLLESLPEAIRELKELKTFIFGGDYMGRWELKSVDGLQYITSLQTLDLSYNQITDISFLSKLTSLQTLYLRNNQITDISFLSKLTSLQSLDLRNNQITDYSFLSKLTSLQTLDLSYNQITDISFLSKLTSLQTLDLRENQITDISFLSKLTSLHTLYLSSNQITDISFLSKLTSLQSLDLRENQITDISFLSKLTSLQTLDLSNNQITDISFLSKLTSLHTLDLSNNQITDISFLSKLTSLHTLYLRSNQITDISFLSKLTSLQTLDLRENQITDISFLSKLTSLQTLDLSDNQITDISFLEKLMGLKELELYTNQITAIASLMKLKNLKNLDLENNEITDISSLKELIKSGLTINMKENGSGGLVLFGNPIVTPPLEIVKQGNEAVLTYFDSLKEAQISGEGLSSLNEIKLLLVGEGAAGKTSLLKQLKGLNFDKNESKTHGINVEGLELHKLPVFKKYKNLKGVTLNVWDFGGQEIMHASHQIFMTNRSIYIYLIDSRVDDTQARKDYWLHHIERFGGGSPAFIAMNKIDKNPNFDLERASLNKKYPFIENRFYPISCSSGDGLEELKCTLAELIPRTKLFQTQVAESWIKVKQALEKATEDERYIGEEEFNNICETNGIEKERERKTLLRFLHDLGIVFHFENLRLKGFYVLDPLWVTVGIYRIINSYVIENGVLKEKQLEHILNKEDQKKEEYSADRPDWFYKPQEQVNLLDIMEEFELLYPVGNKEYLIPDLLPREPEILKDAPEGALHFILRYDFLSQSLYNRLIVQMREDIESNGDISRGQSLFINKVCDAKALVNLDLDKKRIDIQVWGEEKRQYLTIIRDKLEKIHYSFSGLKVERRLPVPNFKDETVDFDELIGLERMGEREYLMGKLGKRFSISDDFLDKVTTKQERMDQKRLNLRKDIIEDDFQTRENSKIEFNPVINFNPTIQGSNVETKVSTEAKASAENKVDISIQIENTQNFKAETELLKEDIEDDRKLLQKHLNDDEIDAAIRDVDKAEKALSEIEKAQEGNVAVPTKSKSRLGKFIGDLGDEESTLYKTLKVLRKGKDYGTKLARTYNKVAENIGMPSVPPLALDVIEKL